MAQRFFHRLCAAISSRTLGTSRFGTSMKVWDGSSNAASSRRQLPPPSEIRSAREPCGLVSHPILGGIVSVLSVSCSSFSAAAPPVCKQCFARQVVRRDHENAVWLRVWNVDHAQVSACLCLSNGNARAFRAGTIFSGVAQDKSHLLFPHAMIVYVGLPCVKIPVVPGSHLILFPIGIF